jgi:hypothetical protein
MLSLFLGWIKGKDYRNLRKRPADGWSNYSIFDDTSKQ